MRLVCLSLLAAACLGLAAGALPAHAAPAADPPAAADRLVVIGTGSGPAPDAERGQPANLLQAGGRSILIDVGDGATQQLGRIGVPVEAVTDVVISHLHFDHTGGLFGLLARRYQLLAPGRLAIYGPVGTKATVDALLAAIDAGRASMLVARKTASPADGVTVTEIGDGWAGAIGDVQVRAASNSHYSLMPAGDPARQRSLALRFDTTARSITYCGDTGLSAAVEKLAAGSDILVCEIMDPDVALAALDRARPGLPAAARAAVEAHFRTQHLAPADAGRLAAKAGVKTLILTHNAIPRGDLPAARRAIAAAFPGKIIFAEDLDSF